MKIGEKLSLCRTNDKQPKRVWVIVSLENALKILGWILPTGILSNNEYQPINAQLICIDVIRMLTLLHNWCCWLVSVGTE